MTDNQPSAGDSNPEHERAEQLESTTPAERPAGVPIATHLTPERWKPLFLQALQRHGMIRPAAREIGIHHDTVYAHRQTDPDFAAAIQQIRDNIANGALGDRIRETLIERAIDGWVEPVYGKRFDPTTGRPIDDGPVGIIRRYDNKLLQFVAERTLPDMAPPTTKLEHTGHTDKTITFEFRCAEEPLELPPTDIKELDE